MGKVQRFVDLSGLTKWVCGFLFAGAALSVEGIVTALRGLWIVGHPGAAGSSSGDETMQTVVAIVTGIVSIVGVVLFFVWLYKAYRNAHALGAALPTGPGFAVGYFFIPYLAIYKPFLVLRDLWRASADPANWDAQKSTPLILLWWLFRLANALIGVAASGSAPKSVDDSLGAFRFYYQLSLSSELINIVALLLEAALAVRIWERMRRHAPVD